MNDAEKPALTTEDCIKIARRGAEFWNRLVLTVLGVQMQIAKARSVERVSLESALSALPLSGLTPLGDDEWRSLGWERLPEWPYIADPERPWISFAGVDFSDKAKAIDFSGFSFPLQTSFKGATFGVGAGFDGATFGGSGSFDGATFGDQAHFAGATFGIDASFDGATFGMNAHFAGATFGDSAHFAGATFDFGASFAGTTFGDYACFDGAVFRDFATLGGWPADRLKSLIEWVAGALTLAGPRRDIWVNMRTRAARPGEFSSISFAGARFASDCSFSGRTFVGPASFSNARFGAPPEFAGTDGHGFIDPHGMAVTFPRRRWRLTNREVDSETTARIRRLRKIMADIHAQDVERDLFILERQAERAIAWNGFVDGFKTSAKSGESEPRPKLESKFWRRAFTAIAKPLGVFKPLGVTVLLLLYGAASNFGRSIARPFLWLLGSVAAFHAAYWQLWAKPVRGLSILDRDLVSYSVGNLLPFVNTLSPARGELLKRLFCPTNTAGACIADGIDRIGQIVVPLRVEGLALLEGVVNAVLLFLLLQAIRNYFKMK